jgi:pimeloyl-ACP methyl ester carboxylesterase
MHRWTRCCLMWIAAASAACASPSQRIDEAAAQLGFERERVSGAPFDHVLYYRDSLNPGAWGRLHVYLTGDGSPLRAQRYRPPDPTYSRPLMLNLMALDPHPGVLLGRPGHHGASSGPWYWTQGRYSEAVVESLVSAVESLLDGHHPELVLIGHSGGGTLAMLMASRLPETRAVVTVAGNLDVSAWTSHHRDVPLDDSLNPADRPHDTAEIHQIHVVGGRDEQVPAHLSDVFIGRQPHALRMTYPGLDHACCWQSVWREVLQELESVLNEAP